MKAKDHIPVPKNMSMKLKPRSNEVFFKWVAYCLLGLTLSACTRRPAIDLVDYKIEIENDVKPALLLTISAEVDLVELAESTHINPVGSLHICDHERYGSVRYLRKATRLEGDDHIYIFIFPASLERLVVFPARGYGEITSGWPRNLVDQAGVCFQIRGGITGDYIRSEIIQIPGLSERLLD